MLCVALLWIAHPYVCLDALRRGVNASGCFLCTMVMGWPWKLSFASVRGNPNLSPSDKELVRGITEDNASVLRKRYGDQRALASACRRDRTTTAEDAAVAMIRKRWRSMREHMDQSAIFMSLDDLRRSIHRATGACAQGAGGAGDNVVALREVLAYVESDAFKADSAAHLAALERLADESTGNGAIPGERALAAMQARVVRGELEPNKQLQRAHQALQDVDRAGARADNDAWLMLAAREHLDRTFQFGYAEALWRGIEGRLPSDIIERRGKMPPGIERAASAARWSSLWDY